MNNIVYVYRTFFKSVYVYQDGSETHSRESLPAIFKTLNSKTFVKSGRYIINIECIHKVRKKEITLNNGVLLKLSKKNFDTVRWAVHRYYHDRLH
ncbi:LytTR family transcriptional regulator DNA-binding domain-containing protein [Eisenbergiella tayi]|uniref:LytTr DNA-binding domain protein n=1 Tax=Eisenbergiella tayi TaxID=1432052 RepID=A0A1E3A3C7_9FIRM|nr:LytTr DNA-binding domain protein [Eisenbergiella tayi]